MIQRIQHLFLILISLTAGLFYFIPFLSGINPENQKSFEMSMTEFKWSVNQGAWTISSEYTLPLVMLTILVILPILVIFQFNKRKRQINILNIFYVLILAFVYFVVQQAMEEIQRNEFSIQQFDTISYLKLGLVFIWIILNFLAIRGIQNDEKLIKSADRIR